MATQETETPAPPATNRYVTTHDANGSAVFSKSIPEQSTDIQTHTPFGRLDYLWASTPFPSNMNDDKDIETYQDLVSKPLGVVITGGTGLAIVNMKPGVVTPMHRTTSMDYNIVLDGEIELVLDSGEKRTLRAGDSNIMRGTMHAWRNVTPNGGWARLLCVSHDMVPIEINGEKLGEDWNGKMPT